MKNLEAFEFPVGTGLVTNHSISMVTYFQPKGFKCFANHSALARNSFSLMVVPYPSQLFQPMGGVSAKMAEWWPGMGPGEAGCWAEAAVRKAAETRHAVRR